MMHMLRRLASEDSGQDIIEYALLAAGIAILMIPIVPQIGQALFGKYTNINSQIAIIP